jgi:AbiTii
MPKSDIAFLLDRVDRDPVSKLLARALRVAQLRNDIELERWIRLELEGYFGFNPALKETDVVPEYRTIVGQHTDEIGRPLVIQDPKLGFVNETRARWGAVDLEAMLAKGGDITIRDPHAAAGIKQYLEVDVTRYTFASLQLEGVLAAIRLRLSDAIAKLASQSAAATHPALPVDAYASDEIVELRPNVFGLGLNLRALWRWLLARVAR